uniref:G_PROTEIN_RECEP_F1_2 domain-containing protein n=1 Tax=Onchocerca volvulus TaxID=6282 RepID=A0A8R1XJV5_ONCVO
MMNYENDFRNICDNIPQVEHQLQQKALTIIWWSNVICLPTIAIIGLACNLFNILILSTHSSTRRIPSWDLLLALAICDCLFLITATLEVTPTSISPLITSSSFTIVYIHSSLYIRTLASTFYKSSVLLVVIFNLERYIYVCHPLRSHNLCSNHISRKYYRLMDYFTLIAFNILPIVILCILNTRLIVTLRKITDRDLRISGSFTSDDDDDYVDETMDSRRIIIATTATVIKSNNAIIENAALVTNATRSQRSTIQRFNANAMLFAVVIMLLICVGPQAPARLLFNHYGQYHLTTIIYICVTQQLVFLNAALNFCLYCLVSRQYRQLMMETFHEFIGKITEKCCSPVRLEDTTRHYM